MRARFVVYEQLRGQGIAVSCLLFGICLFFVARRSLYVGLAGLLVCLFVVCCVLHVFLFDACFLYCWLLAAGCCSFGCWVVGWLVVLLG